MAFVAGLALMSAVPYRFFPMNERDQLIVDLWMPAGTRLAGTDEVLRRLADAVRREPGVRSVAAFTGGGAPRFYYNHNPEPPTPNFGQLLINTASPEATNALVAPSPRASRPDRARRMGVREAAAAGAGVRGAERGSPRRRRRRAAPNVRRQRRANLRAHAGQRVRSHRLAR